MKRVPDKSQSLAAHAFTASPRRSLRHPSPTTSSSPSRASFTDEIASFSASGWQRGRGKSSLTTRRGSSQRLVSKARLSGNPRARLCLLQRDGGELPQSHDLRASYVFLSRTYVYTRRLRRVYVCVCARARVYSSLALVCTQKSAFRRCSHGKCQFAKRTIRLRNTRGRQLSTFASQTTSSVYFSIVPPFGTRERI